MAIRDAIDSALHTGREGRTKSLFTSDGEGYRVVVNVRTLGYLEQQPLPYMALIQGRLMMRPMKLRETMWAKMEPDVYGGKTCDQVVPRWRCFADGDKDSDMDHGPLQLAAAIFPPGTKVTIAEPICPDCGDLRRFKTAGGDPIYNAKCECGFDWETWVLNEFS